MTEENYQYRTSQAMLRNQFEGEGAFQIPIIPKASFNDEDFRELLLIGFDRARPDDKKNRERMVHFFLYDYKFERVWKDAEKDLERLKNYRAVLSPDFSMYQEMNPTMQLYNTFRNRWCGAYWADKGLRVIPTVSWGNENTFDFCFLGIPKGSTIAVSTYMVSEHDNRCDQKDFFMKGYREMLRRIEPERIICYNTPFPEMEGNIVFVDYELSSWKYQEKEYEPSPYAKYITGELPLPENSGIIIKRGCLLPSDKGMGSAYGAQWKPNPNKPQDKVFIGPPNTIQRIYIPNRKGGGYWVQAKYGDDGWAAAIRHETEHNPNEEHSNPHDHYPVAYDPHTHAPDWYNTPEINYWGAVPEFKARKEKDNMINWDHVDGVITNLVYDEEAMRFKTISEFKDCVKRGAEIVFEWNGIEYGVFTVPISKRKDNKIHYISQCGNAEVHRATVLYAETPDEILEYMVGNDRLRDVITQVFVNERTF